jgi:hypothetical protein
MAAPLFVYCYFLKFSTGTLLVFGILTFHVTHFNTTNLLFVTGAGKLG